MAHPARRELLGMGGAARRGPMAAAGPLDAARGETAAVQATGGSAPSRIKLAVSTYSYWHFRTEKYPIEKVIEDAARLGFDGVEILHRQMTDESPVYVNKLLEMEGKEDPATAVPKSLQVLRKAFG